MGGEVTKAKRIRIYPTTAQKSLFRQWLGTSRYVYNETVKHLDLPKEERAGHWMGAAKIVLPSLPSLPDWAGAIPYQIKKIAIEDAYTAFSNGVRKWKQTGEPFDLRFRSRKNPKQSCFIPSSALKDAGLYPRIAGSLKRAEDFPDNPRDSRLVCEQGRWFVIVPYRVPVMPTENQGRVVALDPGIRTFLTGFAEDQAFKIGEGDFARIARLCVHLDRLMSRLSQAKCRQKARIKQAIQRLRWKIRDLVDELHFQAIRFLLDRFDLILLPTFETKEMAARTTRKIRSKTVRSMLGYAFFRFGQRLESAAKQAGKAVLRVNEAYTSKTASWTGEMKQIGGAKTITSGGITVDRDINGARGIFLRALVDTPSLRHERACVGACEQALA
jgi:putative transposase|nr:transposase [uncultured Thiocystis sp.]